MKKENSPKRFSFLPDLTDDDRILLSKVVDWAEISEKKYITKFSAFLDERQADLCRKALASVCCDRYRLWGGYENAERCVLCVHPPYSEAENEDFPITALTFSYRSGDRLTHRDFLGSFMALNISRDSVGDILVGSGKTAVFMRSSLAQEVASVQKIGRVGVSCSEGYDSTLVPEIQMKEINGTVASLRFDCVAALALGISREKAAAAIKGGNAEINHLRVDSPSRAVQEGDKFSVRGRGKFLFQSVNGESRKERLHITVCKYI